MHARVLVATALACAACLLGAGQASAAAVSATCADLQTKLDAANNGDVITLDDLGTPCTGIYTLPAKPSPFAFTLQGAGSGATFDPGSAHQILTGSAAGSNEIDVTLRNLTFRNGNVFLGEGSALYLDGNVSATVDHDRFLHNTAGTNGGAVRIASTNASTPISITNSVFGDGTTAGANRASNGGAVHVNSGAGGPSVVISNNVFDGNTAFSSAGALNLTVSTTAGGTMTVDDNVFSRNVADTQGGAAVIQGNTATLRRNTFTGNRLLQTSGLGASGAGAWLLGYGGGTANLTQSDNRFDANAAEGTVAANKDVSGGGERVQNFKLVSRNDRFTHNSFPAVSGTGQAEGAGLAIEGCNGVPIIPSQVENLVAAGNTIAGPALGAGVYVGCNPGPAALTMLDSTVSGNQSGAGTGSTAGLFGGPDDTLTMRNSIVAGNIGAADVSGFGTRIVTFTDACAGASPLTGAGNICANPLLVGAGPGQANVHETQASPTLDKGSAAALPPGLTTDFEGQARIQGLGVDMGADESLDKTPPAFLSDSISPSKFAVDSKGAAEVLVTAKKKKKKVPRGTTFSYRLSEAARVLFTIERPAKGRKVGGKCVKQTKTNKGKKSCKRFVLAGRFAQLAAAGPGTKAFSGRIGTHKLTPGKYRATLVATDATGNVSLPKSLNFTVVKP
jgi:hypothetical protein